MNKKNIAIALTLTITIFVVYYLIVSHYITTPSEQGQFGDMFGTINALFSGLAFLGLTFTILQQNELIKQNSNQIAQSKKEFDTELRIKALTTLITINQNKYIQIKDVNHLESNELQKKILTLTTELEQLLNKS